MTFGQRNTGAFTARPVTGNIGAEIAGVDLQPPFEGEAAEKLKDALHRYHVLFLKDVHATLEQQKRLTEVFGPLQGLPYVKPLADEPLVIAVRKSASERNVGVFGGDWHSDFSFLEHPPAGSLLSASVVPPFGGDTLWSNQVAAYETLPQDLKSLIEGRGAVHVGAPYGVSHAPDEETRSGASIEITRGDPTADREMVHPAVRVHPESGRRALFVNPIYTTRLEGMTEEESRPYLDRLFRHAVRPEFTCRFRWSAGDLVIWDNRTTLHYAINDYDGHERLLYRTTFSDSHLPAIPK